MTTWLARLNFLPDKRASGSSVVAQNISALLQIRGVQQLDFHVCQFPAAPVGGDHHLTRQVHPEPLPHPYRWRIVDLRY